MWIKHDIDGYFEENIIECGYLEVCVHPSTIHIMARPLKGFRLRRKTHYPTLCEEHHSIRLTRELYLALALTFGGPNKALYKDKRFVDWLLEFDKHELQKPKSKSHK